MKKNIILLLNYFLMMGFANAQTMQKIDMPATIGSVPQVYLSVQEAFVNMNGGNTYGRFQPFGFDMQALADKIPTPNPVTLRVKQLAIAQDQKFKADGLDKMSDSQKIDYAKQQGLGGPDAANRLTFAQKMQDPEFKKKFDAMSPQEKVAVVQQQGMIKQQPTMPVSGNPMQTDMMAIMQDPAMREKWQKMSPDEKHTFIENYKKSKGYDESKRQNQAQSGDSGGLGNMLDDNSPSKPASLSLADDAIFKSKNLIDVVNSNITFSQNTADQFKQNDAKIQSDLQLALTDLGKKATAEGIAEAKQQGKTGVNWVLTNPQGEHILRLQFLNKRVAAGNAALAALTSEWNNRQANLKTLAADYQAAIAKINFGEALYSDDSQLQSLAVLAGYQGGIFSGLKQIDENFYACSLASSNIQRDLNDENLMQIGARQLMQVSE